MAGFAVKTWEDQTVATNGQPSPRYHTRSVIITLENEHKQPTTMQLVVINNLISHLIRCFPHPTQDWHYRNGVCMTQIPWRRFADKKRPCWQIWQQQRPASPASPAWSAAAAAWNAWNVHFSPFCHFNYSPPSP